MEMEEEKEKMRTRLSKDRGREVKAEYTRREEGGK